MEPKNAAERKKTFANFLLLFCLCILLVIITSFFSMEVPFKEMEQLRSEKAKMKRERDLMNAFSSKLIAVTDSVENIPRTPRSESGFLEAKINKDIQDLFALATDSNNTDTRFNKYMVTSLSHLFDEYKASRDRSSKESNESDCEQKLEKVNKTGLLIYQQYENLCEQAHTKPIPSPFQ